jgi:hypothetical protein
MEPDIVYLIACDDVEIDPVNLHRINLRGLIGRLLSNATPPFPVTRPEFCVFVMFIGGSGPIEIAVRIVSDATGQSIFRTGVRRIRFTGKPNDVTGATFRIRGCMFPAAGLYWIECLAGPNVIGRQRLWALPARRVP